MAKSFFCRFFIAHLLFPLQPNWAESVEAGQTRYEIVADEVGFGRETSDAYYDQDGARIMDQTFACIGWTQFKQMLRFFFEAQGVVGRFWVPMAVAGCRLSSSVSSGNVLNVDNAEGMGDNAHLALTACGTSSPFEISSIDTGANTITLIDPVDRAYSPARTTVTPLILSHFISDTLEASFKTDELAIVDASFLEVPKEVAEEDSGPKEVTAYLYKFELGNYSDWNYTSFEQSIVYGAESYAPGKYAHSEVTESINLDQADTKISARYDPNGPFQLFRPFRVESIMSATIIQVSLDSDGLVIEGSDLTIFKGEISSVSFEGPAVSATCVGVGDWLDSNVPNLLMQPTCNYMLYSTPCGRNASDWEMCASVVQYPYDSSPYKILIDAPDWVQPVSHPTRPAGVEVFDHFFASGKFESGTGESLESRGILDSDHITASPNIIVTLRYPLNNTPADLRLWAGCDGRAVTCKAYDVADNTEGKFDNYPSFGGFPFVPEENPTLTEISSSSGGKK